MMASKLTSQHLAAIVLIAVLGITSAALFIWMGAIKWADQTGLSVAVIFIILTIVQGGLSVVWWRASQRNVRNPDDREKMPLEMKVKANF